MENKRSNHLLNQLGQSSVEYILLLSVIVLLAVAILKSTAFQNTFGDQGSFATVYKNEIEFSYTNGYQWRKAFEAPNYNQTNHESYSGPSGSRFFGAAQAYPEQ